ncbi:hypothetical protein ACKAV7_011957 [Fusarium commune]
MVEHVTFCAVITVRHQRTVTLNFARMIPLALEERLPFRRSLTLPNVEPAPTQPGKIRVTTDDELKRFVEIVELGSTAIPVAASSPLELDKLASTLVSLLQSAAKAAGRPTRKGACNAPWWTEECALAAAGYRAIRRLYPLGFNQEVQIAKRDFHRVVRRAKRLYWRNLINSFSDSSSVFKAVRWLRSPGAFQPPPLQVDDVVYETQLDKANALRRATLERRTAEDDIQDPWIEVSPRKMIPFPHEISLEEAQDATLRTGNTSLGADNITVKLLAAGWPERLAQWAGSFIDDRSACVRYQDTITPLSPLQCGLPQGSPVSLILFLLYTEPIYRLSNPQGRFGYADNTAILCIGDTVEEMAATASRSVEEMVHWGAANGVSFDPKKTEVMHFSRTPKGESAEAFLQWVETVDLTTWIVYSDGLLSSEGAASYGFAIHQKDLSICDGSGRLGPAEVFDAEAIGALEGLKAALNLPGSAAQDIIVCLDNLAAATCLRGTPSDSS